MNNIAIVIKAKLNFTLFSSSCVLKIHKQRIVEIFILMNKHEKNKAQNNKINLIICFHILFKKINDAKIYIFLIQYNFASLINVKH